MGMNHDIAARRLDDSNDISHEKGSDSTAGLAVIALLLALVLGFSAVDIHRQAPDAGPVVSSQQGQTVLDGRGKWAGYM